MPNPQRYANLTISRELYNQIVEHLRYPSVSKFCEAAVKEKIEREDLKNRK